MSKAEADRLEAELALSKKSAYVVGIGVKQRREALEIAYVLIVLYAESESHYGIASVSRLCERNG